MEVSLIKIVYRLWLSINSTFWMVSIFGIKDEWSIKICPRCFLDIALIAIPLLSSFLSIVVLKYFTYYESGDYVIEEIELADNELLPVYLGYLFVSLGIENIYDFFWIYGIVVVFVFLTSFQYFNPVFIIFGYHFYHAKTQYGTKVFLVLKGKVVRNVQGIDINKIQRLNDSTYVGWRV